MPTDADDFDDRDGFQDDDADYLDEPGRAWPPPDAYPPPGGGGPHRTARRAGLLAVTAVLAGAAGFGVVAAALRDASSGASPGTSAGSSPSAGSATPGGPQAQLPPPAGPGQQEFFEIGGKVTAVSATSITVGGPGQSVTAAVTTATKVTGDVSGIRGVKVGDFVAVAITGTDGKFTAETIQDPASMT